MNLLDKKTGLILLSALFLSGCEDPELIGLSIRPEQDLLVEFEEITIKTAVILADSLNTTNSGRLLFGNYHDPLTGAITAEAYSRIRPETISNSIPDDAELDSAELRLQLNYSYGTDFAQMQQVSVHELLDSIQDFDNYSSNRTAYRAEPLGQADFLVDLDTDTTLVIPLALDQLADLFEILKTNDYGTQAEFEDLFPGIAITSTIPNSLILGANPNTLSTVLKMFYSSASDELNADYDFFFNAATHYSSVKANFTGTALEELTEFYQALVPTSDSLYMQGATGLSFALDFSPVIEFADTISNLTITQTDMEIGPIGAYPDGLTPPPLMTLVALADNNAVLLVDSLDLTEFLNANPLAAVLNQTTGIYNTRLTRYVQLVLEGELEDNRLFLIPANNRTDVHRTAVHRNDVVLKIFYTTFTQ